MDDEKLSPELETLVRIALDHHQAPTEENHHRLVMASMAAGRLEPYERDSIIYDLAKLVADLSLRLVRR